MLAANIFTLNPSTMPDAGLPPLEPALADLLALWESAADGTIPCRCQFPPERLFAWMGWLIVLDVVNDGADFVYRLHGSEAAAMIGADLTGTLVSALPADIKAATLSNYRKVVSEERPQAQTVAIHRAGHSIRWQRLALPLCRQRSGAIDQILVGIAPLQIGSMEVGMRNRRDRAIYYPMLETRSVS